MRILKYRSKKTKHIEFLKKWVEETIATKGWERRDDIHIDEIEKSLVDRLGRTNSRYWFHASLYFCNLFHDIIDKEKYHILLLIPLSFSETTTDPDTITLQYAKKHTCYTPPSLYLDPIEFNNHKDGFKDWAIADVLSQETGYKVYYSEDLEEGEGYYRYLSITSADL